MYTEGFEELLKMNKTFTAPLSEWNRATTEICRRMLQQNLELMGENFSCWSDQLKRFSNIKKPEDFFTLQKECLNEDINMTIESFHKMLRISMLGFEEYAKLFGTFRESAMPIIKRAEKATEKTTEKLNR